MVRYKDLSPPAVGRRKPAKYGKFRALAPVFLERKLIRQLRNNYLITRLGQWRKWIGANMKFAVKMPVYTPEAIENLGASSACKQTSTPQCARVVLSLQEEINNEVVA